MPDFDPLPARRTLTSHDAQIARVDRCLATNGETAGDRLIRGQSLGGFHFTLHPDRGLDLGQLEYQGLPLGWIGPAGFPSASRFPPDGEDGLGILRAFSGFLVTCGYDYFGGVARSGAAHFDYPLRTEQSYPVHGRAWTLPADIEVCRIDWEAENGPEIIVSGGLSQRSLLGEQIRNARTYRFAVGKPQFELHDTITNIGHKPVPHRLLYHINLGYPLIDTGTLIAGYPPSDEMPAEVGPLGEEQDQRFRFVDRSDCSQSITVTSPASTGLRLKIEPIGKHFQKIGQWWNRYPGMNVIGVEPASADLPVVDENGRWEPDLWLQPGESADYQIRFSATKK